MHTHTCIKVMFLYYFLDWLKDWIGQWMTGHGCSLPSLVHSFLLSTLRRVRGAFERYGRISASSNKLKPHEISSDGTALGSFSNWVMYLSFTLLWKCDWSSYHCSGVMGSRMFCRLSHYWMTAETWTELIVHHYQLPQPTCYSGQRLKNAICHCKRFNALIKSRRGYKW